MLSERNLRITAAVLALAGIGVATYIAVAEGGGGVPKCLAGGHGCETVARSHYSHLAGINVAVIGIFGYVLLLAAAIAPGDLGRFAGLLTALIGFGFSAYLTYLELFVIDAICQWCVASAVLMALSLAVAVARAYAFGGRELSAPPLQSPHGR
ncbi:MAG: vitamin K epoxide reductase family protein [Solirubrobacterales bacterium]